MFSAQLYRSNSIFSPDVQRFDMHYELERTIPDSIRKEINLISYCYIFFTLYLLITFVEKKINLLNWNGLVYLFDKLRKVISSSIFVPGLNAMDGTCVTDITGLCCLLIQFLIII